MHAVVVTSRARNEKNGKKRFEPVTPTALVERANPLWMNGEGGGGGGGIYLVYLALKQAHLALFVSPSALLPQGLNSTLQSLTQERNGLLSDVSTLEERISSVENENKVLQEKVTSLTEEKTAAENEVVLLKETLQTVEKEKQVSVSASQTLEQIVQFSVNFCIFKSSRTYSV